MSFIITRNYDGYGSGFLNPDSTLFHINISKNASSYMADVLPRQGWTACCYGQDTCNYANVKKMVVILRDPVDRWISGVSQYLVTKILNYIGTNTYIDERENENLQDRYLSATSFLIAYSPLIERFIFDKLDLLDDHVWAQHEFFKNILPQVPRHYIVMNQDFNKNLQALGIVDFPDADRNDSNNDNDKAILKSFFRGRLENNPSLLNRVRRTYARDYQLIESASNGSTR
jgi:hypothetical protein